MHSRSAFFLASTLGVWSITSAAPLPSAEKLLPDDTVAFLSAPGFPRLRSLIEKSAPAQLLEDTAVKPFKDNLVARFRAELSGPLETDLGIDVSDYADMAQGQVTLAVTRSGGPSNDGQSAGLVLLLDAKDKADQLRASISRLRVKWDNQGKPVRVEKIRNCDFLIVPVATSDVPSSLQQLLPHGPEPVAIGPEPAKKPANKPELVIGRMDSLLIIANSVRIAEKILAHVSGTGAPSVGDLADYQASQNTIFKNAPVIAWVNVKALNETGEAKAPDTAAAGGDPLAAPHQDKYLAATGLMGIRSLGAALQSSVEGTLLQVNLSSPESGRQSLFKLPPGEARDCTVPSFIPADTVTFRRTRLDGPQAWGAFEKLLADISPQSGSGISAILDLANQNARLKDPAFDIRKNLIGNLGNDFITYSKAPRSMTLNDIEAPPGITLLSSPNPEQFVAALQYVLIFMSAQADKPVEREFLGRKILSVSLPALALPFVETKPRPPRTVHYAASGGYVALSTDAAVLEEFLRRSEGPARALRETPGLTEAAQKVLGPDSIVFGFENEAESFKSRIEEGKLIASRPTNALPSNLPLPPFGTPEKSIADWMDFSLLPPHETIARYFHFNVYGVSAGVDGFTFKYFMAAPPALRSGSPTASR